MKSMVIVLTLLIAACGQTTTHHKDKTPEEKPIPTWPDIAQLPIQVGMPTLMQNQHGDTILTLEDWEAYRLYLKDMLAHYQYGRISEKIDGFTVEKTEEEKTEQWTRRQYNFALHNHGQSLTFRLGIIIPNAAGRYPVIIKNDRYTFDLEEIEQVNQRAKYREQDRLSTDLWVAKEAVERGYIYAKFNREDIFLDQNGPKEGRIFSLFLDPSFGAIAAWAWTYQPIIDWLSKQSFVDSTQIVATGHSRGGKVALCAGVYDERIAITAPNSSGLGGTASMRYYDLSHDPQTIGHHAGRFRHWWPDLWYTSSPHVSKVPFDAHFTRALIAPRALINTHARHDYWANPFGTQLTYLASNPVFALYNKSDYNAMHWRDGGHGQLQEDWLALFDFCDQIFFGHDHGRSFDHSPLPGQYQFDTLAEYDITRQQQHR